MRAGFVLDFQALSQVLWSDLYRDIDGQQYVVELAIQDAGGHRTSEVYDFCRANPGRIIPSFGRESLSSPYKWSEQTHYPGGRRRLYGSLKAVNINTKFFKDEVSSALTVELGDPGGIALYANFPLDYANQLVVEFINDQGRWECPPGRDNHLWDCLVLCFAAAEIREIRYHGKPQDDDKKPAKASLSGGSWLLNGVLSNHATWFKRTW